MAVGVLFKAFLVLNLGPITYNERVADLQAGSLIEQGGVRIDGTVISDRGLKLPAGVYVVQVGKRKFARITLAALQPLEPRCNDQSYCWPLRSSRKNL